MIHAILNPLTKSDIIVYQIDCQFIKERNLLPVFPERQHSIMPAHDSFEERQQSIATSHEGTRFRNGELRVTTTDERQPAWK